jgi:fucose 4-O-acetylase-like acetyltransferase
LEHELLKNFVWYVKFIRGDISFAEDFWMETTNDRERLPDILRGFNIILVVLGHCIQDGSGVDFSANALYFSDKLYQFIYSFHMPLFMIVSGYLAWGSVNKANDRASRRSLLGRRAQSLLIPIFFWTGIDYIRILVTNYINGSPQPEALVFVYFYNALNNLWFLWAVWWCFLIVYIVHYFMKDNWAVYAIIFLALFVIPDGLGLGAYKYMLPFFVLPYYINGFLKKHEKNYCKPYILPILVIIYIGLFSLYNEESFIYLTGYKLIGKDIAHQLYIDFYRMIIGFVGSGVVILLWKYITQYTRYEFKLLRRLGTASMGIYILSGYIIVFVVQKLDFIEVQSYFVNIIETLAVLAISALLVEILVRIPYIRKIVGK